MTSGHGMRIISSRKLKNLTLTFGLGGLFHAKVDAIVNSEQTDFILSWNPNTISGQIRKRYGDSVQKELDEATKGQTLPTGTVVETSGGEDFKKIFHAGFHDPGDWPDESHSTDYFESIGSCTTQILNDAIGQGLRSVAFPLIGCGLFGLDEKMLIEQFLDAVEILDNRLDGKTHFDVWIVIRDRDQFESVAAKILEMLLSARQEMATVHLEPISVSILDRFVANRLTRRISEDWAKLLLCHYAEIALDVMYYSLNYATQPSKTPKEMFPKGGPPTFGERFRLASNLASALPIGTKFWGSQTFATVLKNKQARFAIDTLIAQRNDLAHGRQSKPLATITDLVKKGLRLHDWASISKTEGPFRPDDWSPWIRLSPRKEVGLFDRWQENWFRYVVPETGEVFKVPDV